MPFELPPHAVWLTAMCLISGFALLKGKEPERLVAAGNLSAWFGTVLVDNSNAPFDPQLAMLWVDTTFFAFILWLALSRDRAWLLFAAAFQLLALTTHLAIIVDPDARSLAYLSSLTLWGYMFLASLGAGTFLVARRRTV
jgi:hypothetical protein